MTWLPFVASLVHSLAWPAGAVTVITVLRRPIGAALSHGVRRVRRCRTGTKCAPGSKYEISAETLSILRHYLDGLPRTRGFGNGHLVRDIFESTLARQAQGSSRLAVRI